MTQLVQIIGNVQSATIISVAIMLGLASFGTALSFSLLGGKLLEATARQPELSTMLMLRLFLIAGLVDAFAAITIAMGLLLLFGNNPLLNAVIKAAAPHVG
ncbi:MAG: F0F1 ATP synthase subunit C [Gammaproteobacteria bacterium]|nr:F0F1 ATP synthase subunit C [Gammaproteobacteria bacterium]